MRLRLPQAGLDSTTTSSRPTSISSPRKRSTTPSSTPSARTSAFPWSRITSWSCACKTTASACQDQPTENHGGLGLRIMRNRAAIIRATLTIEPAKPAGTVVTCALARTNNEP